MKRFYLSLILVTLSVTLWIFWPRSLIVIYVGPLSGPEVESGTEFYRGLKDSLERKSFFSPKVELRTLDLHRVRRTWREDLKNRSQSQEFHFIFGNLGRLSKEGREILETGRVPFMLSEDLNPDGGRMVRQVEEFFRSHSFGKKVTVFVSKESPVYGQTSQRIFDRWAIEKSMEVYEIDRRLKVFGKIRDQDRAILILAPGFEANKLSGRLKSENHRGPILSLGSESPYNQGLALGHSFLEDH